MTATKEFLKRSSFLVGMARALNGLQRDVELLIRLPNRTRAFTQYLETHQVRKLHIGASNHVMDGWLNTDFHPERAGVYYMDATRRFPFEDATFDFVMAEHMIEHISYPEGEKMVRECYRVLRPGGRVRFATPDLRVLLELHSKEKSPEQQEYLNWMVTNIMPEVVDNKDVFVINNAFRAWGHQFLYDKDLLACLLRRQGFHDIIFFNPGVSNASELSNVEAHGREIQAEHINQFETMVIEASKGK